MMSGGDLSPGITVADLRSALEAHPVLASSASSKSQGRAAAAVRVLASVLAGLPRAQETAESLTSAVLGAGLRWPTPKKNGGRIGSIQSLLPGAHKAAPALLGPKTVGREDSFAPVSDLHALRRVATVLGLDLASALERDLEKFGTRRARKLTVTWRNAGGWLYRNSRGEPGPEEGSAARGSSSSSSAAGGAVLDGRRHGKTVPLPQAAYPDRHCARQDSSGNEATTPTRGSRDGSPMAVTWPPVPAAPVMERALATAGSEIAAAAMQVLDQEFGGGSKAFSVNLLNLSASAFEAVPAPLHHHSKLLKGGSQNARGHVVGNPRSPSVAERAGHLDAGALLAYRRNYRSGQPQSSSGSVENRGQAPWSLKLLREHSGRPHSHVRYGRKLPCRLQTLTRRPAQRWG
mmetsp:Transcript_40645/g.91372  ORF Transcript_40645/g.91372 Transcript_40645/m.91372 type:complete len:404 (-) Transcript_40645:689-1900(-)